MDPLSLTASVIGVASAALAVSKKLYELEQKVRNGHAELLRLAESIRNNATLLRCTVDLIEQHESLFKEQLKDVVRDINGQFDNITRLFKKLLPHKLSRKRDKLRARAQGWWASSKIQELTAQLFALGNTLSLILDVAHLAEIKLLRNQNELAIERTRIEASRAIENCIGSVRWLKETEHHELPPDYREMLAFDETARDMALWMAVILSAPGLRSRPMLPPQSSTPKDSSKEMRRRDLPEALPFGDLIRVVPEKQKIEGSSHLEAIFPMGDVDDKTMEIFNLPYRQSVSSNGRKTLVVEAEDDVQIDMIVGMNAVLTLPNFEDLTIDTSPLMCLPKNATLCRLLAEWTNMTNQQIRDTAHVEPATVEDEDLEQDSSASEGSGRDSGSDDNEYETKFDSLGDRGNNSRRPVKKDTRWTSRVTFENPADQSYKPNPTGQAGLAGRFSAGTDLTGATVQTLDDDESLRDWKPGQRRPAARGIKVVEHNLSRRLNGSVPRSRNPARSQTPSKSLYHQTGYPPMPPPLSMPYYPGFGPEQPPGQGLHPPQAGVYPAPPPQMYPVWPAPVPPPPPPSPPPVRKSTAAQKQPTFVDPIKDDASEDLRTTNISMRSSQVSMIANDMGEPGGDQDRSQKDREPAPKADVVEDKEELRARLKTELRAEVMAEVTQEKLLAVQVYQDKHREHLEAYTHEMTYDEMYQQAYQDLKRKQAEEEERVKDLRKKIREELKVELEEKERRRREEEEVQERLRRVTEVEERLGREIAEQQQMEAMRQKILEEVRREIEGKERRSKQEDDLLQGRLGRTNGVEMTGSAEKDQVSQCDVFSFIDEESFVSDGGSAITSDADDNDDDETETTVSDATQRSPKVERSRPWKGISHLGSCSEVVPFYIRGSNAGQTWYHGDDPIYIVEFAEDYHGAEGEILLDGQRPYLLVDKLWVEAEALDKFGFRYTECPPSYYFLDPSLPYEDIQVLVDFTFALREISNFKHRGRSLSLHAYPSDARLAMAGGVPPPLDFFGPIATGGDRAHVRTEQSGFGVGSIGAPEQVLANVGGDDDETPEQLPVGAYMVEAPEDDPAEAYEEETTTAAPAKGFVSNLLFVLGALKFAMHTIS